ITGGTTASGTLALAGYAAILAPSTTTLAYVDTGAALTTPGNVSLVADGDTTLTPTSGANSFGGLAGAGVSNSAIFESDDTESYVKGGAVITAQANRPAVAVYTGQKNGAGTRLTTNVTGLALTATAYENLLPITAGGAGGGAAAIAGSANFTVL